MKLCNLVDKLDCRLIQGSLSTDVTDIIYDSRKKIRGSAFVCLSGARQDGHEYVKEAIENGAQVIVTEHAIELPNSYYSYKGGSQVPEIHVPFSFVTIIQVTDTRYALAEMSAAYFGYPAEKITTIGITGTKGKTTVSYMVKAILEQSGIKTGLIGTIETIVGDSVKQAENTTPESYEIQKLFREIVDAGMEAVVMEVSSQGLKLKRVAGIVFDYGIFTNLAADHIGPSEHRDMDDYISCKSLLFQQCRHGILNKDDLYFEDILKEHTCDVETYGFTKSADLRVTENKLWKDTGRLGIEVKLEGLIQLSVKIGLPGCFTAYNAMAAIAVCRCLQVENGDIQKALLKVQVKGRVEMIPVNPHFTLMIDYAHNAMSLISLLTTLREYNPTRIVCLFGCGGNRSRARRFQMGEASAKMADLTVVTSDNPREERPMSIIQDIITGVKREKGTYVAIPDRKEAIRYCLEHAKAGDVIVLAGKGHENYQEIKGVKFPMDERKLIRDIIKESFDSLR